MLRTSSAAETSSTSASATCPLTSAPRQRSTAREEDWRCRPAAAPPARVRVAASAGARPKRRPVATVATSATAEHARVELRRREPGRPGRRERLQAGEQDAREAEAGEHRPGPRRAGSRSGARSPAAPRGAPSAPQTASSRCRPSARTSCRLATFRHAIASTAATAPSSSKSEPRTSRVTSRSRASASARKLAVRVRELVRQPLRDGAQLRLRFRERRARPQPRDEVRLVVAAIGEQLRRECRRHQHRGSRGPPIAPGVTKPGGSTPTTWYGCRSSRMLAPTIAASPPKRQRQRRPTGSPPSRRPRGPPRAETRGRATGPVPSTAKKSAPTACRTASPAARRRSGPSRSRARPRAPRARARGSRRCWPARRRSSWPPRCSRDRDEPVGLRIGQRPQHDGVDEREERRVRADPERERQHAPRA